MEIKPIERKDAPKYPVREEVSTGTLVAAPPLRWLNNTAAKIALGTLAAMSLAGCAPEPPLPPEMTTEATASCVSATPIITYEATGVSEPVETPVIAYMPAGDIAPPSINIAPPSINIAPLFLHGEGMGAFGCVMIAPPAFLSEEEALSVINAAAEEYGLEFTASDAPSFSQVLQPTTDIYNSDVAKPPDTYVAFSPDFVDSAHGVSIEYISTVDVQEWNFGEQTISGGEYNTVDAAAQLSEALEGAVPDGNSGVFKVGVLYDPCASVRTGGSEDMAYQPSEQSRALAQEQLKSQAKDFFEWLKNQGVI